MDPSSIATALVTDQAAQTQFAVAGLIAKSNASQDAAVVGLVDAAAANASKLAELPTGVGGTLDVTA